MLYSKDNQYKCVHVFMCIHACTQTSMVMCIISTLNTIKTQLCDTHCSGPKTISWSLILAREMTQSHTVIEITAATMFQFRSNFCIITQEEKICMMHIQQTKSQGAAQAVHLTSYWGDRHVGKEDYVSRP